MSSDNSNAMLDQSDSSATTPVTAPSAMKITKQDSKEPMYSEMIPEDLLFALTEVNDLLKAREEGPLAPVKTLKTPKEMRVALKKGVPDNVWHHKGRRIQFRHLTDYPRSDGKTVGTRDISFLYDVAALEKPPQERPSKFDRSAVRLQASSDFKPTATSSTLTVPDTIVPDEYHLVKSKAVLGLEYLDEKLTTNLADTEKTLRIFPSLKPTKRFEVVQLIKTMDQMLSRAGVDDIENEAKGPTQIHNLLEIIKKEQQIYDVVFHEVIRQVSIECVERGQLLSKLRQRYAELLNRIPRQIKSLHAEVMAQRSLDRRLTEELLRFKSSIGNLTDELLAVKEHDKKITSEAQKAQLDLAEALKESQANANLVDEYHDLYELQRQRLENQVTQLTNERDLWCNASYSLALKVIAENSLSTAKRLHVTEKAWHKLGGHFTVLISDQDTESLVQLQQHVQNWRDLIFHFNQVLEAADKTTRNVIATVKAGMQQWIMTFEDTLISINEETDIRTIKIPPRDMIESLYTDIASWEEQISEDSERFGGDTLLSNQEQLIKMEKEVESWTDIAIAVYDRHRSETGEVYPLRSTMTENNTVIQDLNKQLQVRISGENGVAKDMITMQNNLDTWNSKMVLSLRGAEALSDSEWLRFYDVLLDYVELFDEVLENIGSQQSEEDRKNSEIAFEQIFVDDTMKLVHDWLKETLNGIDGENGKLVAQVSSIHTRMVHWMVQMLLYMAPSKGKKIPAEASLAAECSLEELTSKCKDISEQMSRITCYLCQCTKGIVQTSMQRKKDAGETDFDHEYRDFMRVKGECKEWIRTCQLLLNTLLDQPISLLDDTILSRLELKDKKIPTSRKESRQIKKQKLKKAGEEKPKNQEVVEPSDSEKDTDKSDEVKPKEKAVKEIESDIDAVEEDIKVADDKTSKVQVKVSTPELKEKTIESNVGGSVSEVEVKENEEADTKKASISRSLEIIGEDENVQSTKLDDDNLGKSISQISVDELLSPSSTLTQTAYDAIAKMDELQNQLLETEERAQKAEYKSLQLEENLTSANEKIRALEREIAGKAKEENKTPEPVKQEETTSKSPVETLQVDTPKPGTPDQGRRLSSRGGQEKKKTKSKKK